MIASHRLKAAVVALSALALFGAGLLVGANKYGRPNTIIHLSTGEWTSDSTPEQRQAAIDGIKTMAGEIPGIKNIWIKSIRVQPREYHYAFAIEFEDKAAADRYIDHQAHKDWMKVYEPIRKESRSTQVTN